MPCFRVVNTSILLDIKAVPGASKTEIVGIQENRLRVKIAAAPEDGKANAELCAFFAKSLGCAKKDIVIKSGEKSRIKTIVIPVSLQDKVEKIICI